MPDENDPVEMIIVVCNALYKLLTYNFIISGYTVHYDALHCSL